MTENASNVLWFRDDDPQMQQAYARARETFRYFWREVAWESRRIVPALELALIKMPFCDHPEDKDSPVEQMWVSDLHYDGQTLSGILANAPHQLQCVSEGDEVQLTVSEITDWLYAVANDRVYGAFTVNVMRSRMSAEERLQHDSAWGLDFGDPDEPLIVPQDWCHSDSELADVEHPMSESMVDKLVHFLHEDPMHADSMNEDGMTLLHELALAGSVAGVEVLLRHHVDPDIKTPHGMTARDLAAKLGWTRVVEVLDQPQA